MNSLIKQINNTFQSRFNSVLPPILVQSPGRVNLIGEHTDYNNGFVLPASIDKVIVFALAPNEVNKIRLHAVNMSQSDFEIEISEKYERSDIHWVNYILGAVDQLTKAGKKIGGFDCVFGGDIPVGAGLSSSAALEGGFISGLSQLFKLNLSKKQMAQLGQKAENDFVGVQCGIMDHFANLFGKKDHVLKLDCRSLDYQLFPFKSNGMAIILCDTNLRRDLATSEYNLRRRQCEAGVRYLQKFSPEIQSLRDVSLPLLKKYQNDLDPVVFKRCSYVIEENQRVLDACNDLLQADMVSFGNKMYQSHYGLRDQFEVSCKELDILVEATEELEAVLGSRMMGGGFGGCTINLVQKERLETVLDKITKTYQGITNNDLDIHVVKIGDGTNTWSQKVEDYHE